MQTKILHPKKPKYRIKIECGGIGVLDLTEKTDVINRYIRGENNSKISRETGISRPTVIKYVNEYVANQQRFNEIESEKQKEEIIISTYSKPKYKTRVGKRYALTADIESEIIKCLKENEIKKQKGNRKIVMTAVDIHNYLLKEKHGISYRSVALFIQKYNNRPKEAFIRQQYAAGEVAEFDWGEITLYIEELDLWY